MRPGPLVLGAGVLASALASARSLPDTLALPRPAPQLRRDADGSYELVVRNGTCERCHADVAAEWRTSRHAAAHTNDAYRASLSREAPSVRPFCERCHAPEVLPGRAVDARTASLGVSCLTCHVPLGPVLAAPGPGKGRAPHALLRSPSFSDERACAACHEFAFPGARGPDALLMQTTVREHLASGAADRAGGCARCHMPIVGEGAAAHRSHRFRGGYDPDLVRRSLRITSSREGSTVVVSLAPIGVTHAVPTGDLFRRLAVEAVARDASGRPVAQATRFLARHLRRRPEGGMALASDDRPSGDGRSVRLALGPAAQGLSIDVRVAYQRVELQPGDDEERSVVGGEIELHASRLAPD